MDRECKLKDQIDDMKSTVESLNDKLLSAQRRSSELEHLLQLKVRDQIACSLGAYCINAHADV